MFERFTAKARQAIVRSQEEARARNHNFIGTEHLLLGIIGLEGGVAWTVLQALPVNPDSIVREIDTIVGRGAEPPLGHIPFTDGSKKSLELSLREALQLSDQHIGTEHLLLGLLSEGEGVAAQVLASHGADLQRARASVSMLVGRRESEAWGAPDLQAAPPPPAPPVGQEEGSPLRTWALAHAATVARPEAAPATVQVADAELRAAVNGLPLLARAGIVLPLALLADLVRFTGGAPPVSGRLRPLADLPGITRLRLLAWPPPARVALAGLLACDLPPDAAWTPPDAEPAELRDALVAALGGVTAPDAPESPELRRVREQIAEVRRQKMAAAEAQDINRAAAHRSREVELLAAEAALVQALSRTAAPLADRALRVPVGEGPGWQPSEAVVDALSAAAAQVTELTIAMLEILGAAAVAAEPTLPVKMRHRVTALPRIGIKDRRLIMEAVTLSAQRSDVTALAFESASGTTGVSRRGKITGLLPAQLALPEELLDYRHVGGELLYRVSETDTQSLPETVTLVLDTSPATYGPPELVLRLVAHVMAMTMWAVRKTPALVTLDRPGLVRQVAAPADLVTLWTARSLEPPDIRAALTTARRLGLSTILLTERHAMRDLRVMPQRGLRVLTTHVADDPPPSGPHGPFHVHLPPDPSAAQVVKAVRDLLEPETSRRAS